VLQPLTKGNNKNKIIVATKGYIEQELVSSNLNKKNYFVTKYNRDQQQRRLQSVSLFSSDSKETKQHEVQKLEHSEYGIVKLLLISKGIEKN